MNAPKSSLRSSPLPARQRTWRILIWSSAALGMSIAFLASIFLFVLTTETGTRAAWSLTHTLTGGRLSGTLASGTLATGLRIHTLRWQDRNTDIHIDHLDGQWQLALAPLRLTVDSLDVGTVDARLAPSPNRQKTPFPKSLTLPFTLDIQDVRMKQLRLHSDASTTEFNRLKLHAASNKRHHRLTLEQFETPLGTVSAQMKLDGQRPFAVHGTAHLVGKLQDEALQLDARISGSLEQLIAEINASGLKLTAHARVEASPLSNIPLKSLTLSADHLNPYALSKNAPHADIAVRAQLAPLPTNDGKTLTDLVVAGPVIITNMQPGPLHQHRLPLIKARADVQLDEHTQALKNLRIQLVQDALIEGSGAFKNEDGQLNGGFDLKTQALNLSVFAAPLRKTHLSGPLVLSARNGTQHIIVDLSDTNTALHAQADITLDAKQIALKSAQLKTGQGYAKVSGVLQKGAHSSYQLDAMLDRFEPFAFLQKPPQNHPARISGTVNASGDLAPEFKTQLTFALRDSVYAALPLTGAGTVHLVGKRVLPSTAKFSIAGNHFALRGGLGGPGDTLSFNIDAPQLGKIGFGLDGALKAGGTLSGPLAHPKVVAHYQVNALAFQKNRIGQMEGQIEWHDNAHGILAFSANGHNIVLPNLNLNTLQAKLVGTRAQHTLTLNSVGHLFEQPLEIHLTARGGFTETRPGMGWMGTLLQLNSRGLIAAQLKTPMAVRAGPNSLTLGATQLALENAQIDLHALDIQHNHIRSAGTLKGLDLQRLVQIQQTIRGDQASLETTLVLDGQWDFMLKEAHSTGTLHLVRRAGDIQYDHAPIGLDTFEARLNLSRPQRVDLSMRAQAARIGTLEAQVQTLLTFAQGYPNLAHTAPLSGTVRAEIPTLKRIGALLGPQYLLDGHLALNLALSGLIAQPTLSGTLTGEDLSMTLIDEGVTLKNGVARIAISNNRADFQKVEFEGASGTVRATGSVALDRIDTPLSVQIVADALELFARPDRQLSISGRAMLAHQNRGTFTIDGDFKVNRAFFNLPANPTPRLGDDVVIVRSKSPPPLLPQAKEDSPHFVSTTHKTSAEVHLFQTRIGIDLGQNFIFHGAGAELDLIGKITLSNAAGKPLRAQGDLRTRRGSTYKLLGTKLDIEKGYVTFNGPVDNPALNILAMRRNQEVEAGVQIRGTTRTPRAQLVSEPNVPDTEKLSWLLFGRGTDKGTNPGQQHAKNAALAFLGSMGGKKIAQNIGLDEFSIGQSEAGLTDPQVITLAKALNRRFILGYEQGLSSGAHIFKVTWQFWHSWSVVVHAGTVNGINMLFSRRFD